MELIGPFKLASLPLKETGLPIHCVSWCQVRSRGQDQESYVPDQMQLPLDAQHCTALHAAIAFQRAVATSPTSWTFWTFGKMALVLARKTIVIRNVKNLIEIIQNAGKREKLIMQKKIKEINRSNHGFILISGPKACVTDVRVREDSVGYGVCVSPSLSS